MNSTDIIQIIRQICERMAIERDYLSSLDSITGDGEHGINMDKGFSYVRNELHEWSNLPIDIILKNTGVIIMNKTGGSAGVLYGSAFIAASEQVKGKFELTLSDICLALKAGTNIIIKRGKVRQGDKTMLDTLFPATEMFCNSVSEGKDKRECFKLAEKAAYEGMIGTKDLIAKKGRSSYQGKSSIGHIDPGAASMYFIFNEINKFISN